MRREPRNRRFSTAAGLFCGLVGAPALAAPDVVVSINPLHSLVAGVMDGVAAPLLLVEGAGSPHSYSLKPSQAKALNDADIVFWIGDGLEAFLAKPLLALSGAATVVEIAESDGIDLREIREGGTWDAHAHDGHGEADHNDHGDDHGNHAEGSHDYDGHDDRAHNLHLWLDPQNARRIVEVAVDTLRAADPRNAARYAANGDRVSADIDELDADLSAMLGAVKDRPYIVFHDAYPYFEARYGLLAVGSITLDPEHKASAARLTEIRDKIRAVGAVCVFSEPQFTPAQVRTVVEGSAAKTGVLDPLGADVPAGPAAYETIMRDLGRSLAGCLSPTS